MFRHRRLKRIHARYLESSRVLGEGRAYWTQMRQPWRWLAEFLAPDPLLSLSDDGRALLGALRWLEENCRKERLSEATVLNYHRLLGVAPLAEGGGYRKGPIAVQGSKVARPGFSVVPSLMKEFERRMDLNQKDLDADPSPDPEAVFASALRAHQRIAFIHPFRDGNGRVARLSMNHLLRRYGLGYVILPPINHSTDHFRLLEAAHQGSPEPFFAFARSHHHRV